MIIRIAELWDISVRQAVVPAFVVTVSVPFKKLQPSPENAAVETVNVGIIEITIATAIKIDEMRFFMYFVSCHFIKAQNFTKV
jgi:hypothetical protein